MSEFPQPPIVEGFAERRARWGERQISPAKKAELIKAGRVAVLLVGGMTFIREPFGAAMVRIAKEDAAAGLVVKRSPGRGHKGRAIEVRATA